MKNLLLKNGLRYLIELISRKIFPISNKHKECNHKGEDHTAAYHTWEEHSYRTNIKANYLKNMFNTP